MTKAMPGLAVSSDPNLPAIEGKIQRRDLISSISALGVWIPLFDFF